MKYPSNRKGSKLYKMFLKWEFKWIWRVQIFHFMTSFLLSNCNLFFFLLMLTKSIHIFISFNPSQYPTPPLKWSIPALLTFPEVYARILFRKERKKFVFFRMNFCFGDIFSQPIFFLIIHSDKWCGPEMQNIQIYFLLQHHW